MQLKRRDIKLIKKTPKAEDMSTSLEQIEDEFKDIPEKTKQMLQWKAAKNGSLKGSSKKQSHHADFRSPTIRRYEEYLNKLEEQVKVLVLHNCYEYLIHEYLGKT